MRKYHSAQAILPLTVDSLSHMDNTTIPSTTLFILSTVIPNDGFNVENNVCSLRGTVELEKGQLSLLKASIM